MNIADTLMSTKLYPLSLKEVKLDVVISKYHSGSRRHVQLDTGKGSITIMIYLQIW